VIVWPNDRAKMDTCHGLAQLGFGTGLSNPDGLQVWVWGDAGTGDNSPIWDVQNKPKNMIFGRKLNEIQLIS
jgi:hypothetical protein